MRTQLRRGAKFIQRFAIAIATAEDCAEVHVRVVLFGCEADGGLVFADRFIVASFAREHRREIVAEIGGARMFFDRFTIESDRVVFFAFQRRDFGERFGIAFLF